MLQTYFIVVAMLIAPMIVFILGACCVGVYYELRLAIKKWRED